MNIWNLFGIGLTAIDTDPVICAQMDDFQRHQDDFDKQVALQAAQFKQILADSDAARKKQQEEFKTLTINLFVFVFLTYYTML